MLKVCQPELAPEAIWLSNGMLGNRVAIWRRELPKVIPLGDLTRINSTIARDVMSKHGQRWSGGSSKFESHGIKKDGS